MSVHPDAFKPVSCRNSSNTVTWLFLLILGFLEMFPDTQVGTCDLFFSTLRSVGRAFVCVEVQSLIDPVVNA